MKKLTCEVCGGTDLMKQDDVFVCQFCGMKYSAEDARKLMIEGTVEVQGVVQVKNTAQQENLMKLARSSYDSKNYVQTEEFCNQIIAMDADNYEAWKLKGEAINYQITGTNDRIAEVYNCIMTSYKVLDEDGKNEHREEILKSLRVCLEGEIDFVLGMLTNNRPTDGMLKRAKNTFIRCASDVITSYKELGYGEDAANEYRTYIKNYFIKKVNAVCETAWDDIVSVNYYRDGWDDEYHPNEEIMRQFINEGDRLIALLNFAEKYFDEATPLKEKRDNYQLQNFFNIKIANAKSYKRMVETTTNGYGAVTNRREYWSLDKTLTDQAKAARQKEVSRTCELYDKTEIEMSKQDPATREKLLKEWQDEIDSVDLSYRISAGSIFGIILCVLLGVGLFCVTSSWFAGFEWLGILMGACCIFIGIAIFAVSHAAAKAQQSINQGKVNRLEKKIREIS